MPKKKSDPDVDSHRPTVVVKGVAEAYVVIACLMDRSAWFELTPLPMDRWEIMFKKENKRAIEDLRFEMFSWRKYPG